MGATSIFNYSRDISGPADLFIDFGQFIYQDTNPDFGVFSSDTFLLTFQAGADLKFSDTVRAKIAPIFYAYAGRGAGNGLNRTFTGEGFVGLNTNTAAAYNNSGINDLAILEVPAEVSFKFGRYNTRLFADFAYNFQGGDRADHAAEVGGLDHSYRGDNKAAMAGFSFGTSQPGMTLNMVSKKNTWEARVFWQHVEQYALDVNLLDSDFFEGRGNLEGYYFGFAYSFTDSILTTFRYGYANRINQNLGTGGTNPDLPVLNPIRNYHILQLDLSYRF